MKPILYRKSVLSAFTLLLALTSAAPSFAIELEQSMPENQKRFLSSDFRFLERLDLKVNATLELLRLFSHSEIRTHDLTEWLDERVKVILPETWDSGETIAESASVPNLISENTGLALFLSRKTNETAGNVQLNGNAYPLLSPRSGLIRVGTAFFSPERSPSLDPDSTANSVSRLAAIFHEGRHSDGNGESLGFPHIACPDGHPLAERKACDGSQNGAYAVDAEVTRLFLAQCIRCTTSEKDVLRAQIADAYSRVIQVSFEVDAGGSLRKISAPELDAAPEMRSL